MENNTTPDNVLVQHYLQGSEESLKRLIQRHKEKIFTSIVIFTKDQHKAEDLFQEVWIKAIDKLQAGKYKDEGKFLPWMRRLAYNMCVDNYRKEKRKPKNLVIEGSDFNFIEIISDDDPAPDQGLLLREQSKKIRELIDELPPDQKEIILLRHYYDFLFKEIAEMTGLSINTCLGRMRYALINLRKIIKEKNIVL